MPSKPIIPRICEQCGSEFLARQTELNRGGGRFCRRECTYAWRHGQNNGHWKGGPVECQCRTCGITFHIYAASFKAGEGKYCSRKCLAEAKRTWVGDRSPRWQGGTSTSVQGYIRVHSRDGNHRGEHRRIMEQIIGRALTRDEHVHHINHDRTDNRPENLVVLIKEEHLRLHAEEWRGVKKITRWTAAHERCIECGTNERPHGGQGLCRRCYGRQYRTNRR